MSTEHPPTLLTLPEEPLPSPQHQVQGLLLPGAQAWAVHVLWWLWGGGTMPCFILSLGIFKLSCFWAGERRGVRVVMGMTEDLGEFPCFQS